MINLPPVPPDVKHIAHFLKIADEHDDRNIVVSYWSRLYACQVAMKSIPGKKPPEVTNLLVAIMDWLERAKKEHSDSDGITNEAAAQALIEQYAIQLFQYADAQDLAENFGKNVVKAFYTAGILMDVLEQFGDLSEDIFNKRKYAKWKAAYIHNCLKNGERPLPGPPNEHIGSEDEDDDESNTNRAPPSEPTINESPNPPGFPFVPFNPPAPFSSPAPTSFEDGLPSIPTTSYAPPPVPTPQPAPVPAPQPSFIGTPATPSSGRAAGVGPEQIEKAQKYCKFAGSALNYDDVSSAIDNLQKALNLLQFGVEK